MIRPYYFGAGPAALPQICLEQAQSALLDWEGTGVSIAEIGHRSEPFMSMLSQLEADCRELLSIPDRYHVFFTVSPARAHFSMIPLNFINKTKHADYIETGMWSEMAIREASRYGKINVVASSLGSERGSVPARSTWKLDSKAAYCYFTANETVNGVQFPDIPDRNDEVSLVSDMTSCLFSAPLDISRFGMVFAGVQKNIAPSGLTLVIVDQALFGDAHPLTPSVMNYEILAGHHSLYYTTNTFSCYMAYLMCQWLKAQGGLQAIALVNQQKADLLYHVIDTSPLYENRVEKPFRSCMNVPFYLADPVLEPLFLEEAKAAGLLGLQGHRAVGGLRASLYNAVSLEATTALANFMKDFQRRYG